MIAKSQQSHSLFVLALTRICAVGLSDVFIIYKPVYRFFRFNPSSALLVAYLAFGVIIRCHAPQVGAQLKEQSWLSLFIIARSGFSSKNIWMRFFSKLNTTLPPSKGYSLFSILASFSCCSFTLRTTSESWKNLWRSVIIGFFFPHVPLTDVCQCFIYYFYLAVRSKRTDLIVDAGDKQSLGRASVCSFIDCMYGGSTAANIITQPFPVFFFF